MCNTNLEVISMPIIKICKNCGKEYKVKPSHENRSSYCSKECKHKGQVKNEEDKYVTKELRNCIYCGNQFKIEKWSPKKYCSKKCSELASMKRKSKNCIICGKEYKPRRETSKFCSEQCMGKSKQLDFKNCIICNKLYKPYSSKVMTCSNECAGVLRQGENNGNWKGEDRLDYENSRGKGWFTQRKKALKRDNYICQECGVTQEKHIEYYGRELTVHHKIPYRFFNGDIKANKLDNLITLCVSCHGKQKVHFANTIEEVYNIIKK